MDVTTININIIRLKDQQCARLTVSTDISFKNLAIELERAGLIENAPHFDNWVFLNKFNDECYQVNDDVIGNHPIKNNGTMYVIDTIVSPLTTSKIRTLELEVNKLRQENSSLQKAIDILSRNM